MTITQCASPPHIARRQGFVFTGRLLVLLIWFSAANAVDITPEIFYVEDIKEAMRDHLAVVIDEAGAFLIHDGVKAQDLTLRFVKIHDPVRQIGDGVYFACTDFHVDGTADMLYDIDFWLQPENGQLQVFQTKIHKEPRKSLLYGWYKHPRYTFVDDEIEYLYDDRNTIQTD